jgi:ABC-type phosphate transport system auxiliary subunit
LAILGGAWIYLLNITPSNNATAQMYQSTTPQQYQQYTPLRVDMSQSQQQMTDMQSELEYYRSETSVLQDRVSTMSKKLAVLGALTNENVVVVRDGWPRSHMVTLSKDWSLSRMPQHLKLTEEDQAFLEDWSVRD